MRRLTIILTVFFSVALTAAGALAQTGDRQEGAAVNDAAREPGGEGPQASDSVEAQPSYGEVRITPLGKRDSLLVGDRILCSVTLEGLDGSERLLLPDVTKAFSNDTLGRYYSLVRGWQVDTLGNKKGLLRLLGPRKRKPGQNFAVEASIVVAPFEEGRLQLPHILMGLERGGVTDTLRFLSPEIEVVPIQIDTATFVPHDIKGQMRYPLTFRELVPYVAVVWLTGLIVTVLVCLLMGRRRKTEERKSQEPAHIVALRALDRYRGNKYWAPERQKAMYSGITDTLRTYMEARFGINAEEMTTGEIFEALRDNPDIPAELNIQIKELFELSDLVKFAKMTAGEEENASAVPAAVRFVTSTYQTQIESESAEEGGRS